MKFFIFFILIFIFQVFAEEQTSDAEESISLKDQPVGDVESSINGGDPLVSNQREDLVNPKESLKTETVSEDSEEEALRKFLTEEVIPAFGGFQDLLFSHKPSFDIHWTPQGIQVRSCSFKFQLKQLRTIRYNLADIELYGFQSNAEIGDPRFLFVQVSCGEIDDVENTTRFNIKFFVTGEDLSPSYYGLKIKTMDKEQLDIKLKSIEMGVDITAVDYTLVSDQHGHIEILPHESPFLQFFEEDKAYAEMVENQDVEDIVEDEQIKNMYDIPISIWNQIKGVTEVSSDGNSLVPLKKVTVEYTIVLQGSAEIFLPVYGEGIKEDARVVMPITGSIFSSVDGEVIPVIDISTK